MNFWDYHVETAGLQSGSTGNDSGEHFCKSHLDDGASRSLHYKYQGMSIILFPSLRSASHTICDSK